MIRFLKGLKEIKSICADYKDFKTTITAVLEAYGIHLQLSELSISEKKAADAFGLSHSIYRKLQIKQEVIKEHANSMLHLGGELFEIKQEIKNIQDKLANKENTPTSILSLEQAKTSKKPKVAKLQAVEEKVKKVKSKLTQAKVKRLFEYRDGELYWRVDQGNKSKKGDKAHFYLNTAGYYYLYIPSKQKLYNVSRLIFLMFHGYLPEKISYIDNNSQNTRIENLRAATISQVKCSAKRPKSNSSGYKGVYLHKKKNKYIAQIKKNKKYYYLGSFYTPKEAHKAYCKAAKKLHGEFARLA